MHICFLRQKTQALNDRWDGSMKPQETNAVNQKPDYISATDCFKPASCKAATEVGFPVWRPSRPPPSPTSLPPSIPDCITSAPPPHLTAFNLTP